MLFNNTIKKNLNPTPKLKEANIEKPEKKKYKYYQK